MFAILDLFKYNDHVRKCLETQDNRTLTQLCKIIEYGHANYLDWYVTSPGNNTIRCGRRHLLAAEAENRLIIIVLTRATIKVKWREQEANEDWPQQRRKREYLLLNKATLSSLYRCIDGLAVTHQLPLMRQGFWPVDYMRADFEDAVTKSLRAPDDARIARLQNAPRKPERRLKTVVYFDRNPDVVAQVLTKANGKCSQCGRDAPFLRRHDNTPYLEVHHVAPLAEDGDDTVENAVALCPNCHRKVHFGVI